jgi:pantothenate kinase-related protein Tda10
LKLFHAVVAGPLNEELISMTLTLLRGFEQVVLFEGWMLGFEPEQESEVTAVDPQVCQ